MTAETKRKPEISALNIALCMLVVFIHVSSAPVTSLDKGSWQFAAVLIPWRLAACAVPGFVFLAGLRLFLNKSGAIDYKRFYLTRLTKIVIPYVIFNAVYYVYFVSNGYFSFSLTDLLRYTLDGTLVSPFYFVIIIVQFYILAPLWARHVKTAAPVVSLAFFAVFTFFCKEWLPDIVGYAFPGESFEFNNRMITTYLFYFLAGTFAGHNYGAFKRAIKQSRALIAAVFVFCAALEAVTTYYSFAMDVHIGFLDLVHYMYCVSAVFFLFSLAYRVYENRAMKSRVLIEIDGASYYIFLIHCLAINYVNLIMPKIQINGVGAQYIVRILAVYPASIIAGTLLFRLDGLIRRGVKGAK